jgi:hypothetical protein
MRLAIFLITLGLNLGAEMQNIPSGFFWGNLPVEAALSILMDERVSQADSVPKA